MDSDNLEPERIYPRHKLKLMKRKNVQPEAWCVFKNVYTLYAKWPANVEIIVLVDDR